MSQISVPSSGSSPVASTSFALNMITATTNPQDNTTYFMVGASAWSAAFTSTARIFIPSAGTLTTCFGAINVGSTPGSTENSTLSIRLNNTTDYLVTSTLQMSATLNTFSNAAMSIPVVAGDYISFKIVTPAFATNPLTVTFSATIFIS